MKPTIGFIGQGWIGKHYADEFESRKYSTVRYSLEEPYFNNRALIPECDIVFIAVPTPTTPQGFDHAKVADALSLVGKGKIAVIKSTLLPGTTAMLQELFPGIFVFHSPEFLVEQTAAYDAAHPNRNIIGIVHDTAQVRQKAVEVLRVLPDAPYNKIMDAKDAELVKYAGNCFLYAKVMYMNILFDTVTRLGADWETVRDGLIHDPRVGVTHTQPVHSSGRGAGGHCFIKDFEAFRLLYSQAVPDLEGHAVLKSLATYNAKLLQQTNKDIDLLKGVYGDDLQVP
jgi:nucleotide sugar dehydrogenase